MPGLFGIVRTERDSALARRFADGIGRLQRGGALLAESAADPSGLWLFGRAHLGVLQPHSQGRVGDDLVVWLHGDITNATDLRRQEALPADAPLAHVIARLYERYGTQFAAHLAGAFVGSVLDLRLRRLIVAADVVGSYPLYWRADRVECAISSDLTALIAATEPRPALDLRAVADYLTIGFVTGDRTLAAGISLLGPGETLTFDLPSGNVRISSYGALADLFLSGHGTRAEYIESLQTTFDRAVGRSFEGDHAFALSLSGGLDSRAILSALNGQAEGLTTYTLGIKGCADEVIADALAGLARTNHRFFELNNRYLRDFLPNLGRMVSLTDGLYLSHGFTEMLALQFIDEIRSTVLVRGHGGELAKTSLAWPLHTDETVYGLRDLTACAEYIARRANYLTPHLALDELLQPGVVAQAGRGSADSLCAVLSGLPLTPAQACSYLYLHEHHRRSTVPSLELFRSRIDIRLPFVDTEFLRVLLSAPPEWHEGTEIHRALIGQGSPALLKVRNSNTGAPAGAGPLAERVLEKVNSVLKKANVRGYRHYHNFDGWMRSMLLQSVEQELLSAEARIQSWVRPDTLRRLLQETAAGSGNHTYALQGMLILELWQRENGVTAQA